MSPASRAVEECDRCGFDGALWDLRDTANTVRHLGTFVRHALAGVRHEVATARPDNTTWSIAEYVDHMREITFANNVAIQTAVAEPGIDLGDPPDSSFASQREVDLGEAIEGLSREADAAFAFLAKRSDTELASEVVLAGQATSAGWFARHIVHDAMHHLGDIADIRHRLGDAVDESGTLDQINASTGGVPKTAVAEGNVAFGGLQGDGQRYRQHHGRPWQALCLFSTDVIAALQAEGHPISAGAAGENLTLGGIDWSLLRSGLHIEVGEVQARLTLPAVPCQVNNQWFSGTTSNRISHDAHPGWARWYASVLRQGTVAPGDPVRVTSGSDL